MNIAIVEDDRIQSTVLRNWLEDAGHRCSSFDSADEYSNRARRGDYHLLLLDWELPGTDGIELLAHMRSCLRDDTPVIFITARNTENDIAHALHSGADDYLVKPPRPKELLARIEALARRVPPAPRRARRFGNLTVDTQHQTILVEGSEVQLTQKEYALAHYLLTHTGELITRETLLDEVWGHKHNMHTRTVDTHISRLRRKLQLVREHGWCLGAVYQHGYRLEYLNT